MNDKLRIIFIINIRTKEKDFIVEQVSISRFSIKILTLRTRINNDNTTFAYCHAGREESSETIFLLLLLTHFSSMY